MSTTLIVRDATLAINGAPETRGEPAEHLRARVQDVGCFEPDYVRDCLEALLPSVSGKVADRDALEAVMLIALAHPEAARERGFTAIAAGRSLAVGLEKQGEGDYAMAVLRLLADHHPANKSLERDIAGLMRRQGMVGDLVDRYLERAQQLLDQGRTPEAIAWMREVLQIDRSRRDVARTIRDLRYNEIDRAEGRRSRRKLVTVTLVLSVLVSTVALRETMLAEEYRALPSVKGEDLAGMRERLALLEQFVDEHPIWHGGLQAVRERTDLRIAVGRLEAAERQARERERIELARRSEEADLERQRGITLAQDGDFEGALEALRRSLELSTPDWEQRERVERDIDAIAAYLEESQ